MAQSDCKRGKLWYEEIKRFEYVDVEISYFYILFALYVERYKYIK